MFRQFISRVLDIGPALVVAFFVVGIGTAHGITVELIVNGDFETGAFAGWTTPSVGPSGNDFYIIQNGAPGPISGHPNQVNPTGGAFVALGDQNGPGGETLIQAFVILPVYTNLRLNFDWFNNTHSRYQGVRIDGNDQVGRVDILSAGANAFDVGAGVVQNLILNHGSFTIFGTTIPWQNLTFDLSNLAAGSYQLRFGQGECCFFQETGVDNVSLTADVPAPVPEPATLSLLGSSLVGLVPLLRRRRSNG